MTVPVVFDFIVPFLDDLDDFADLNIFQTSVQSELNCGLDPDFGFASWGSDMNVHSAFFPGKKEKPVLLVSKYGRAHWFESTTLIGGRKEGR